MGVRRRLYIGPLPCPPKQELLSCTLALPCSRLCPRGTAPWRCPIPMYNIPKEGYGSLPSTDIYWTLARRTEAGVPEGWRSPAPGCAPTGRRQGAATTQSTKSRKNNIEARHGTSAPWPSMGPHTRHRNTRTSPKANVTPPFCAGAGRAEVRTSRSSGANSAWLRSARRPPPPPRRMGPGIAPLNDPLCPATPPARTPHTRGTRGWPPWPASPELAQPSPPPPGGPRAPGKPPRWRLGTPHPTQTIGGNTPVPPPKPLGVPQRGPVGQNPGTPTTPPPPLAPSVGPNFSHHKASVQAVGWFPLGTRKQGSRPIGGPIPPNKNGAGPKAGPASPPPPPKACPRTLTEGQHMVIKDPPLAERRPMPNDEYFEIWDPHGNPGGGPHEPQEPMNGQIDPSTTLRPPPPPHPPPPTGGVHRVGVLRFLKVETVNGLQLDRCAYPMSSLRREPLGVCVPLQLHHSRLGHHSPMHSSVVVGDPWRPNSQQQTPAPPPPYPSWRGQSCGVPYGPQGIKGQQRRIRQPSRAVPIAGKPSARTRTLPLATSAPGRGTAGPR